VHQQRRRHIPFSGGPDRKITWQDTLRRNLSI
jgi:hypothetical protein